MYPQLLLWVRLLGRTNTIYQASNFMRKACTMNLSVTVTKQYGNMLDYMCMQKSRVIIDRRAGRLLGGARHWEERRKQVNLTHEA